MPTFYLNLRTTDDLIEDPEGYRCEHAEAAREQALVSLRDLVAEHLLSGQPPFDIEAIQVVAEDGSQVLEVTPCDVLRPIIDPCTIKCGSLSRGL